MDMLRRSCCFRAVGWSLVGVVIAGAWGLGNYSNGIPLLEAFAIPALIVAAIVSVVALALFNVSWFARLCACPDVPEARGQGHSTGDRHSAAGSH